MGTRGPGMLGTREGPAFPGVEASETSGGDTELVV